MSDGLFEPCPRCGSVGMLHRFGCRSTFQRKAAPLAAPSPALTRAHYPVTDGPVDSVLCVCGAYQYDGWDFPSMGLPPDFWQHTMPALTREALQLIAAERDRQLMALDYNPDHDSDHVQGELARAAAVYATPESYRGPVKAGVWPGWRYKPSPDRIRELVKAGALIVAEIERLRAGDKAEHGPWCVQDGPDSAEPFAHGENCQRAGDKAASLDRDELRKAARAVLEELDIIRSIWPDRHIFVHIDTHEDLRRALLSAGDKAEELDADGDPIRPDPHSEDWYDGYAQAQREREAGDKAEAPPTTRDLDRKANIRQAATGGPDFT